jgi:hypothetical protein
MDIFILFSAIIVSAVTIFLVSYLSRRILIGQEQVAKKLDEMAGVQSISNLDEQSNQQAREETSFKSLAQILRVNQPVSRIRILTLSGATSMLRNDKILLDLLNKGIKVDLMLLDPESDSLFFEESQRLLQDTKSNLDILVKMQHDGHQGNLSIRLITQQAFQMLMFIDDSQLFVSSFIPLASPRHLIYEIKNGDKSLYNLYEPMFEYLWNHAKLVE